MSRVNPVSPPGVPPRFNLREILQPAVIVGALGYFVDIYDLILFSIVRTASLRDLGFTGDELTTHGIRLLNLQMIGMLVGGITFGVLGDRLGRVTVLFSSILLYSTANIANGFVHTIGAYEVWRFIAGVGLAGELGGSIALVSEVLSKETRGYGTTIVATVGVFGAVVGGLVADLVHWRTAYFIGGGLGLALLALRLGVAESGMFRQMKTGATPGAAPSVAHGNFLALFTSWTRFQKYARCILIGLPSWFVIGVLVTLAPEFAKALGVQGEIKSAARAVAFAYLGLTFGDFASGWLSQQLGSRKKIVGGFLLLTTAAVAAYLLVRGESVPVFYGLIFVLGLGVGYWAVFVSVGAEQFGTNLRATVATTVPNFVRGALVPITLAFTWGKTWLAARMGAAPTDPIPANATLGSAALVGAVCLAIAFWALHGLEETHGKDLDYLEPE
jgi:putative MFS transporter